MTPNATVSFMVTQVEQQLVEAKAARRWVLDDAANAQTPGRRGHSLLWWLVASLVGRFAQVRQQVPLLRNGRSGPVTSLGS